ncbi:9547_t:CDS:2 [Paraglomus brasilianum]|uniref:Long-chain-alcohol oxidase n=1 Tax=Paraglomus brasilianum TaxID=144538 RepID=A0A9N8WDK5_9GLOM|nr:9547_t:CDS:2 [Paraglomus brasilianum]
MSDKDSSSIASDVLIVEDKHLRVLSSLCSTYVGKLEEDELDILSTTDSKVLTTNNADVQEFGKYDLGNDEEFIEKLVIRINTVVRPKKVAELKKLLRNLSKPRTARILTGFGKPFYELTQKQREAVLKRWATSTFVIERQAFRTFLLLICSAFWLNAQKFYPAIGYPGPDPDANYINYDERTSPEFKFIEVPHEGLDLPREGENEIDVVIIGSGAGGGVAAAELAKAGYKVLILEKGKYYQPKDLTLEQMDAVNALYEQSAWLSSEDGSVSYLAGSTFGGGTTINWSACLKPQYFVREEWASKGLAYFLTDEYRKSMNMVLSRLGVTSRNIVHNSSNKILVDGCKKLGYPCEHVPQNSADRPHQCGWCGFGCKYGEKQGSVQTWLQDARDHGARFVQDCFVQKILVEKGKDKSEVYGVQAVVCGSRTLRVHCKKVIVAAGAIHSPALLLRSGLKNRNIGRNFFCHPTACVYGVFPGKEIKTYTGTILTTVSGVVENADGNHYGAKIEVGSLHPAFLSVSLPWRSSLQHKQFMTEYNHIVPLIVIVRDRDGGKIVCDADDMPAIQYTLSQHDAKSMTEGVVAALKILVAAGASKIGTCQNNIGEFRPSAKEALNDPEFVKYLGKVRKAGFVANACSIGSSHQMGSCRMGVDSMTSVVNPDGQTWEVENLYVADASVFPTAVGINPMITIMSSAYYIAKHIINGSSSQVKSTITPRGEKRRSYSMRIANRTFTF